VHDSAITTPELLELLELLELAALELELLALDDELLALLLELAAPVLELLAVLVVLPPLPPPALLELELLTLELLATVLDALGDPAELEAGVPDVETAKLMPPAPDPDDVTEVTAALEAAAPEPP
jgi:hypothetical protein